MDAILSRQETRFIGNDYTVRVAGKLWQIQPDQVRPGLRNGQLIVETRLDGSLWFRFADHYLAVEERPLPLKAPKPVGRRSRAPLVPHRSHGSRWMEGFDMHRAPTLGQILAREGR